MELHYKTSVFAVQSDGNALLMITIPKEQSNLYDKIRGFEDDKPKVLSIDYVKEKRTLTSNGYLWAIINKMARKLNTTDDEVYIELLKRYGVKDFIAAPETSIEILKRVYKIVEPIKDCTINSTKAKTFKLIRGSSQYDKREFSQFLDGVLSDAKELGIETMSEQEIQSLIDKMEEL